jgi:hypothetical protein
MVVLTSTDSLYFVDADEKNRKKYSISAFVIQAAVPVM